MYISGLISSVTASARTTARPGKNEQKAVGRGLLSKHTKPEITMNPGTENIRKKLRSGISLDKTGSKRHRGM